jgi:hypothetical protein
VIQRTLDVRFPVYVVITKSDLIIGFREFFANMTDLDLQHQILGWSNPGEIDKPYDPCFVDKYLEEMKTRLFRTRLTRLGELLEEDSEERERPAPKTLYAFPHAFEQLGPRLKRYLDLIFNVGSQWSCKPLFFRGIYFTSSMQEGAARDQLVADLVGVPVESLPEVAVTKRDLAYFLRDLFLRKVFLERGLVTRATNARKQYARRRAAVLGFAAVSLVLLIALLVLGGRRFRGTLGGLDHLLELATGQKTELEIIYKPLRENDYSYRGRFPLDVGEKTEMPLYRYFGELARRAEAWEVPWIFRPRVSVGNMKGDLDRAVKKVYVQGVLEPLLRAATENMTRQKAGTWMPDAPEFKVLCKLVALKAKAPLDPNDLTPVDTWRDSLMECVKPKDRESYNEDRKELACPKPKDPSWADTLCDVSVPRRDAALHNGVTLFNAYWSATWTNDPAMKAIEDIARALTGARPNGTPTSPPDKSFAPFEKVEARLLEFGPGTDVENWLTVLKGLRDANDSVDEASKQLGSLDSLEKAWESGVMRQRTDQRAAYKILEAAFGTRADPNSDPNYSSVIKARLALNDGGKLKDPNFTQRLVEVDANFWRDRAYQKRFSMYESAAGDCLRRIRDLRIGDVNTLGRDLDEGTDLIEGTRKKVQDIYNKLRTEYRRPETKKTTDNVLDRAKQELDRTAVTWWLNNMRLNWDGVAKFVRIPRGQEYDPNRTADFFSAWERVRDIQTDRLALTEQQRRSWASLDSEYKTYVQAYLDYWLKAWGARYVRDILEDKEFKPKNGETGDAEAWNIRHRRLSTISSNPKFVYDKLSDRHDGLKKKAAAADVCPEYSKDSETLKEFRAGWESFEKNIRSDRYDGYKPILKNWSDLPQDALTARDTLLKLTYQELLSRYFVLVSPLDETPANPNVASPNCFWHELSLTSLQALARAVSATAKARLADLKEYANKYPLDDSSKNNLADKEIGEIHKFLREYVPGKYSPGAVGEELEAKLKGSKNPVVEELRKLRQAAEPPTWLDEISQRLPGADPKSGYWCQVYEIATNPPMQVRHIRITKGPDSVGVVWEDLNGFVAADPKKRTLAYDCSNDSVEVTFSDYESGSTKLRKKGSKSCQGPWPWHKMLQIQDAKLDKDQTYVLDFKVAAVTVTLKLKFYQNADCSGAPIQIWPKR